MSGGYRQPDGTVIEEESQTSAPAPVPTTSPCGQVLSIDNVEEDDVMIEDNN